jgi:hypothetical protein
MDRREDKKLGMLAVSMGEWAANERQKIEIVKTLRLR